MRILKHLLREDLQEDFPFCICCGRKNIDIMMELEKKPFIDGERNWQNHRQFQGRNFFYDENTVKFCVKCGQPLTEDDIQGSHEFMGMYGSARASQYIVSGYKCSKCGFEDKF